MRVLSCPYQGNGEIMTRARPRSMLMVAIVTIAALGSGLWPASRLSAHRSWSGRADLLLPRSEMSIAQKDGRIYAMGGYPGERITSDAVQVYDSATDSWSMGPAL